MKVAWLTAAIVLIVALNVFGPSARLAIRCAWDVINGQEATAVAVFDTTTIDFGLVKPNELLTARFQVTNAGGKRLIVRTESDCQCTTSSTPLIIPPMTTAELFLPIDAGQGDKFPVRVICTTNDPSLPKLQFSIHGRLMATNEPVR